MAKAREITGIDCAASAVEWAARVLKVRFDEILELRGAVLDDAGIEAVHDMRVATRRLRSALRDFKPFLRKKPVKKITKKIKEVADALGRVRDEDVAILALEELKKKAENEKIAAGIDDLIKTRRERRERNYFASMENLSATHIENLRKDFDARLEKAVEQNKSDEFISFDKAGREVASNRLEEFLDLKDNLYKPFDDEKLHELRISAKRLRYAMELFVACWSEKIAAFADEISDMQDYLGEVHDCDVWIEDLSKKLIDEKFSGVDYRAAIFVLSEFMQKRTDNYRFAIDLWKKWKTEDFINRLRTVIAA